MYGHEDEWIENRVKWKMKDFIRQPSDVLFFTNGDEARADSLRRVAQTRLAGLPILAFWRSLDLWTLLGSEKLVWTQGGTVQEVLLDTVKWADSPGMLETMQRDMESGVDSLVAGRHKFDYEWLRVTDKSGGEFSVWTPPNGGCLILWNVLLMLIRMQKAA